MKTNPNEPVGISFNQDGEVGQSYGLTKREYFAALAMQGLLANSYQQDFCNQTPLSLANNSEIATIAVLQADALIAELNKEVADETK